MSGVEMSLQTGRCLTFVVPCKNEADGIRAAVAAIRHAGDVAVNEGWVAKWELVTVDDGSTDATGAILAELAAADPRIKVVAHTQNRGLGGAIRSGLAAASGDLILYTDADMPCDLGLDVPRAMRLMRTYDADIVAAYRHDRRGEGPRRLVYSAIYNVAVRTAFGIRLRDVNFAFKLFRADAVDPAVLRSEGSFIDVELLARAVSRHLKIVQFGTDYFPRTRGVSTLSSLATIKNIVREMKDIGPALRSAGTAPSTQERPGTRLLIVNADDYGLTEGISEGILRAAETGVVTSTSVLVLGSAFASTAPRLASADIGVGVHLAVVGEDPPLLSRREIPTLVDDRGRLASSWRELVPRLARGRVDPADLAREFEAQLAAISSLGLRVSHLDTHQHLHLWPAVRDVVIRVAQDANIRAVRVPRSVARSPRSLGVNRLAAALARRASEAGLAFPSWAVGLDEAGHMHGARLEQALAVLASKKGPVELSAHPGIPTDVGRYQWHYDWDQELAALSAPRLRELIEANDLVLGTYHDLVDAGA